MVHKPHRPKPWASGLLGLSILVFWAVSPPGVSSAAEKIVIKLGHVVPIENPYHLGAADFAQKVAEKSHGRIEVKIFPNSQLGNERDLAEGLQLGTLQMAVTANAPLSRYAPRVLLFDLPFIFRDDDHWDKVVAGPLGKELRDELTGKGLRPLAYWDGGWRGPYARRPIKSLDDIKGMKFRTMESPMHISIYTALGARGVPMSSAEQYSALQQGVVDGGDSPPVFYKQLKHYEIAKHLTLLPLFKLTVELLVSEKFYSALSPDLKRALQEAADEATPSQRRVQRELDQRIIDDLKKEGVQVYTVSAAEREKFTRAMGAVWKEYEDKVGKDKIQAVLETK